MAQKGRKEVYRVGKTTFKMLSFEYDNDQDNVNIWDLATSLTDLDRYVTLNEGGMSKSKLKRSKKR